MSAPMLILMITLLSTHMPSLLFIQISTLMIYVWLGQANFIKAFDNVADTQTGVHLTLIDMFRTTTTPT